MANQYEVDPRQALFLKNYLDPKSATFSNALQSGIKAGYSQEYSESLTAQMPDWLSESLGMNKMLKKAEKNLDDIMSLPIANPEGATDKVVADVSKFVVSRIGKAKWSERTELTGADGKELTVQVISFRDTQDTQDVQNTDNSI